MPTYLDEDEIELPKVGSLPTDNGLIACELDSESDNEITNP